MTENELFEQWYKTTFPLDDIYDMEENAIAKHAWQARAELANKEIAELQAQINELRGALEDSIDELEACFNTLFEDEGLKEIIPKIKESLAKTAPQCLQEHDNEVIERCAKVADYCWFEYGSNGAKTIRELKGKQNETT